jgi:hypothetical protein
MCWRRCRTPTAAPPINDRRCIDRRSGQNLATTLQSVRRHDVAVGHLDHGAGCGPYQPQPLLDRAHDLDHVVRAARGVPALTRLDLGGDHVRTLPAPWTERVFGLARNTVTPNPILPHSARSPLKRVRSPNRVPERPDVHAPPAFDCGQKGRRAPRRCPVVGCLPRDPVPARESGETSWDKCRTPFRFASVATREHGMATIAAESTAVAGGSCS